MPQPTPQPAAPAAAPQPPAKASADPGATPMSNPPKTSSRAPAKGIDEFFGAEPKPTKPPPVPTPEPAPEPKPAAKPAEPAKAEAPEKPESEEAAPDLDTILESVKPKPRAESEPAAAASSEATPAHTPRALRDAYEKVKTEAAELRAELEKAKSARQDDDLKRALESIQKERDELAQRLEYADYRESPAFNERFSKPLELATAKAVEIVKKLDHQIEGRKGTPEDVYAIYQAYIQNPIAAEAAAQEQFGTVASNAIMRKVEEMASIDSASRHALDEWKGKAVERRALTQAEAEKQKRFAVETFTSQWDLEEANLGDALDVQDDKPLGDTYNRVKQLVKLAFVPDGSMSPEQHYRHSAKVAAMAAATPVLLAKLVKAQKEMEALKAEVAEFREGAPRIKPSGQGDSTKSKKTGFAALEDYIH